MKRLFCLFLALIMLLCGCNVPPVETTPTTIPVTTEPTTAPTIETTVPDTTVFADTLISTETYSEPEDPAQRLAYRRDLVEAEMRRMMSMLWTPSEDIVYTHNVNPVTLKAGRIYRGMPYTHGSGAGLGFMTYATSQDDRGVYTISGLDGKAMTGQISVARVGNDCADALFWAWSQVATSITFPYTNKMTTLTGCLPVGSYTHNRSSYETSTKPICQDNGVTVMYESYALLQKGDGMVLYTDSSGGHAVMVCDVHVERNAGGQIDGQKSYVVILEQISSNLYDEVYYFDSTIGANVYLACGVDTEWTFETIFKKGYLPITCKELIDPAPLVAEEVTDSISEYTYETLRAGKLSSTYPIAAVTMIIQGKQGQPTQRSTAFPGENSRYSFRMSTLFSSPSALLNGSIDLKTLTPGDYHCTVTCTISTGRTFVVRDFDFTI